MGMEGRVFRAEGTVCVKAEVRCTFWETSTANPGRLAATIMWGTLGFLTQASYPIEPQVHCHTFEPTYKKFLIFLSLIIQALKKQYTLD